MTATDASTDIQLIMQILTLLLILVLLSYMSFILRRWVLRLPDLIDTAAPARDYIRALTQKLQAEEELRFPRISHVTRWLMPLLTICGLLVPALLNFTAPFFFAMGLLACLLGALFFIDMADFLLPDILVIMVLLLGLSLHVLNPHIMLNGLDAVAFQDIVTLSDGWYGAIIAAGGVYLVRQLFLWIRKVEALGLGDVKMIFAAGFFIGWQGMAYYIVLASVMTILFGVMKALFHKEKFNGGMAVPFGVGLCPALYIMTIITYLYGPLV